MDSLLTAGIDTLPVELTRDIVALLPKTDLLSLLTVCKAIRPAAQDALLKDVSLCCPICSSKLLTFLQTRPEYRRSIYSLRLQSAPSDNLVAAMLAYLPELKHLYIDSIYLSSISTTDLACAIGALSLLQSLSITMAERSVPIKVTAFLAHLQVPTGLQDLSIRAAPATRPGVATYKAPALTSLDSLHTLQLSGIEPTPLSAKAELRALAIEHLPAASLLASRHLLSTALRLRQLKLRNLGLIDTAQRELLVASALHQRPDLRYIDMDASDFVVGGFHAIQACKSLDDLRLHLVGSSSAISLIEQGLVESVNRWFGRFALSGVTKKAEQNREMQALIATHARMAVEADVPVSPIPLSRAESVRVFGRYGQ